VRATWRSGSRSGAQRASTTNPRVLTGHPARPRNGRGSTCPLPSTPRLRRRSRCRSHRCRNPCAPRWCCRCDRNRNDGEWSEYTAHRLPRGRTSAPSARECAMRGRRLERAPDRVPSRSPLRSRGLRSRRGTCHRIGEVLQAACRTGGTWCRRDGAGCRRAEVADLLALFTATAGVRRAGAGGANGPVASSMMHGIHECRPEAIQSHRNPPGRGFARCQTPPRVVDHCPRDLPLHSQFAGRTSCESI
jgi:hypothetical protein